MEDKNLTPAEQLKNNFDSAIETKGQEVAKVAADALDAKANELNESLTKSNEDTTAKTEVLQKQIDDLKMENKNNFAIGAPKRSEFSEQLRSKADEIVNLRKGSAPVVLDLKTLTPSAGADSAPSRDLRVEQIKYDPNFDNRVANHLVGGSTDAGAIRHTFETAETDNTAPKVHGAIATGSAVTLTDKYTPIETIFNVLTLPEEAAKDISYVESYLSTRLMGNLRDIEDVQLLRGNGTSPNYNGLATAGLSFADAAARETYIGSLADSQGTGANNFDVLTAAMAGLANTNYYAGKVFVNPLDYYEMVLAKATTNEYVLAQTIAPDGSYKTFWNGVEIVKTPAQTAGTFTMLDSRAATYFTRMGSNIEFGYNDTDFAGYNISVRANVRGALVAYNPNGIISDTFANWKTALNT